MTTRRRRGRPVEKALAALEGHWRWILKEDRDSHTPHDQVAPSPAPPPEEDEVERATRGLELIAVIWGARSPRNAGSAGTVDAAIMAALELGRLGFDDRIRIGDRRRRQIRTWSASGVNSRRETQRLAALALAEEVRACRQAAPQLSTAAIARRLLTDQHRQTDEKAVAALAKKIQRLKCRSSPLPGSQK